MSKKKIHSAINRSKANELRELGFSIPFISIELFGTIDHADLVREWCAEKGTRELKEEGYFY